MEKGLTPEEAIKAFKEGRKLQFYDDGNWIDSGCSTLDRLQFNLKDDAFTYRIKPKEEEKEVELFGPKVKASV